MLTIILIIYVATLLFGVLEILRDKALTNAAKTLWIIGVVFFNVLAVIAYLIYRNVVFYAKGKI